LTSSRTATPDPDNDGDGVCDDNPDIQRRLDSFKAVCIGRDRCPHAKETINGHKDGDGCPDRGAPLVVLSSKGGKGYLGRFLGRGVRGWFRGLRGARFTTKGARAVKQLAMFLRLRQYAPLRKIVVMAFVEPQMSAARAKRVTQAWAEAVRARLVALGISASRLGAIGGGGLSPVCRSRSRSCRRRNRRVEFFITDIRK